MSMMATEVVIAEVPITPGAQIAERIAHLNHLAKREMAVVGSTKYPTPWDSLHARINTQLDELDRLRA